jgi:hypothetical protein
MLRQLWPIACDEEANPRVNRKVAASRLRPTLLQHDLLWFPLHADRWNLPTARCAQFSHARLSDHLEGVKMAYEIDPKKAGFDEIQEFVMNLLGVLEYPAADRETHIAYYRAMTDAILARKASESAAKLVGEIQVVGQGLGTLQAVVTAASNAADTASRKIVWATWALVLVTLLLGLATAGLVYFTRELALVEALTQKT